ncbi:lipoprotein [Bacillus sp. B15-48]|uniref:LPS translocon maturation chaperone LptM n=1 Tax=Bacillus sp. B15-48 TaxID=1548601 RepID=UPI00193F52C0|nr:lipoprotein [Bacillus sp. B15-48]MBM4762035.1 redoxin domain-containing protein [Bacillus sp. B15-48]
MKKRIVVFILIVSASLLLAACGQKGIDGALKWPVKDFNYVNHEGNEFGSSDLKGKVWIANFIFTNCPDICPPMTANMLKIQDRVKEEGLENVEFISFSVDPEVDSPEVLKAFGERFHVDFNNWNFLTGYTQGEIETFAADIFKTIVIKPEGVPEVIHQSYFYLVDQEGVIMKTYSGLNDMPIDEIINDIKTLQ